MGMLYAYAVAIIGVISFFTAVFNCMDGNDKLVGISSITFAISAVLGISWLIGGML